MGILARLIFSPRRLRIQKAEASMLEFSLGCMLNTAACQAAL
jgi:hypothetical protein